MGVDAAAGGAGCVGREEERGAGRGFEDLVRVVLVGWSCLWPFPSQWSVLERIVLPYWWSAQVRLAVKVHYEHVRWLEKLFLYTRRRNVDVVAMADRTTSSCACDLGPVDGVSWCSSRQLLCERRWMVYPAQSVKLATELADQICRMLRV